MQISRLTPDENRFSTSDLQRVIGRISVRSCKSVIHDIRRDGMEGLARPDGPRTRNGLVEVVLRVEVMPEIAQVIGFQDGAPAEFLFETKVELLGIRVPVIRRHGIEASGRIVRDARKAGGGDRGETVLNAWISRGELIHDDRIDGAKRLKPMQPVYGTAIAVCVVEDAVTAAKNSVLKSLVSKSKARREQFVFGA